MKNRKKQNGFSLVEMMVVVAIIGVLATLAVPRFRIFQAKAKQTEAKQSLSTLYTLQLIWHGENNTYGNIATVGYMDPAMNRYAVTVPMFNATTFMGQADARDNNIILTGCSMMDQWLIDETKAITFGHDCTTE